MLRKIIIFCLMSIKRKWNEIMMLISSSRSSTHEVLGLRGEQLCCCHRSCGSLLLRLLWLLLLLLLLLSASSSTVVRDDSRVVVFDRHVLDFFGWRLNALVERVDLACVFVLTQPILGLAHVRSTVHVAHKLEHVYLRYLQTSSLTPFKLKLRRIGTSHLFIL